MLADYGTDDGKEDTEDDDLIELFENGFCNSGENHVACKEKKEDKPFSEVSKKLGSLFKIHFIVHTNSNFRLICIQ